MTPRDRDILAALEAFAAGRPAGEATAGGLPPLSSLRRQADILGAADQTPRLLRPFGVELFRSQNEFNHQVVDLLEDLVWMGAQRPQRVAQRLTTAQRWRGFAPRSPGLRGGAAFWSKQAFLRVAPLAFHRWIGALERSNAGVVQALGAPTAEVAASLATARAALESLGPAHPLLTAQRGFLAELARLVSGHWAALTGEPQAEALPTRTACPRLSVVLVGPARGPLGVEGVLEVLCEQVLPGAPGHVRVGDVNEARGEWVLRLPADQQFCAGPQFAAALELPGALVYGDGWHAGQLTLRPGWSPEYLWAESYVGGCFAVRTEVARAHRLERSQPALHWLLTPGFQAHAVRRVPEVVSIGGAPQLDGEQELEIVRADLRQRGLHGEVTQGERGRVVRLKPGPARVSIIVPFRDKVELLQGLWSSLCRYPALVEWELILASNQSVDPKTFAFLRALEDPRVRWLEWNEPFNFSSINNAAARQATGDYLLFLNNDVEVRQAGWLADLLGYAQVPGVGVVGARLLYGDGSVQHAGVVVGLKGLAGHLFSRWRPEYGRTPFGWPDVTRNWSAVTGACLLMERARFERLGGFDERMRVSGGDIELCLRAGRDGSRVVCVGHVCLDHFESISRGREPVPQTDVRHEVRAYLPFLQAGDPHFHPRLAADATSGRLALEPDAPLEHALRAITPRLSA